MLLGLALPALAHVTTGPMTGRVVDAMGRAVDRIPFEATRFTPLSRLGSRAAPSQTRKEDVTLRVATIFAMDRSMTRVLHLMPHYRLTASVEAFPLINPTNFELPERFLDAPSTFGRVRSAKPPRQMQLSLGFQF